MTFDKLFSSLEISLNKFFFSKFWLWKVVGITLVLVLFFYVGLNSNGFYNRLKGLYLLTQKGYTTDLLEQKGYLSTYWEFMQGQAAEPFKQHHELHPVDHKSNMAYRLLLPMVFKITHLNILGVYILQILLGIFQLFITAKLVFNLTKDKILAFYFTLAIAGVYFGNAFFYDMRGYGDPWVFAAMTLAIFFRNPILIFIFTQCVFWTDERGLISITFVGLWWLMEKQKNFDFKEALKNTRVISIALSIAVYFLVRFTLESIYHLDLSSRALAGGEETGGAGLWVLRLTMGWFGSNFWNGYEGFLLLIAVGISLLIYHKQYGFLTLLLLSLSVSLATSFMVYDSMRSISYTGIVFFICLRLAKEYIYEKEVRFFILAIAIVNMLAPSFY